MPSTWRISIKGVKPEMVTARGLHAVVSRWLDGASDAAHRAGRKPWTCSPLFAEGDFLGVDIGLLDDGLATGLAERAAAGTPLVFGHHPAMIDKGPFPVAGVSWAQMAENSVPRRSWHLELVTPTAFRSGKRDQTLPQPGSVFGHYRRVWRTFAPDRPESDVDLQEASLSVADLDGRTVEFAGRFGVRKGYVGELEIRSDSDDESLRKRLDALVAVAPYSGTGTDTTAGMGVTRWMD